jgi:hypothetical protein
LEFVSNDIDESELQYEKQSEQRIRTWQRIVNNKRDEPTNAFGSMRVNLEWFSNEIDVSDL